MEKYLTNTSSKPKSPKVVVDPPNKLAKHSTSPLKKQILNTNSLAKAQQVLTETQQVIPERRKGSRRKEAAVIKISPLDIYKASGLERVNMARRGLPANCLHEIGDLMHIPQDDLYSLLNFPRSTIKRKIRERKILSTEQTERIIGLERLVGQVEAMVVQSGNPEGFDANRWVGEWLNSPLPALGGAKPADYMDTMEGQNIVSTLLAQSQSGAYA